MSKDHQSTYRQKIFQVTDTWEELLNNFGTYHNADVISGRYGTIEKSYNNYLAPTTKRPSSLGHPPAFCARHGFIQRQGQSSYNNGRSNYNRITVPTTIYVLIIARAIRRMIPPL